MFIKKRKIKKIIESIIIFIILIIALLLIFNKQVAKIALNNYEPSITKNSIKKAKEKTPVIQKDEIRSISPKDILTELYTVDKENNFIGYVAVPDIGLKQPISNELTNHAITIGAGIYYPELQMGEGNYVLVSHFSYIDESQLFAPLYYHKNDGARKQKMYLTDLEKVYIYETDFYEVVTEDDDDYIQEDFYKEKNQPLLTLFTCNYVPEDGRVLMQGHLIEIKDFDSLSQNELKEIVPNSNLKKIN